MSNQNIIQTILKKIDDSKCENLTLRAELESLLQWGKSIQSRQQEFEEYEVRYKEILQRHGRNPETEMEGYFDIKR